MGRVCSAPGCRTGYPLKKGEIQKVGPQPALFKAPKDPDLFKKWKQKIPRKEFVLKNSFPCDVTALKRVRNKLRPGAVPVLWPGCTEHLSKKEKQKRKPPQKRDQSNSRKKRTVKDSSDVESADNLDPLTLNNQKRKSPNDDEESSSSQPIRKVFLDPSLVAEPDLTREVIEYPSRWIEVKGEELLMKKKE
ncbi:hypothetical protein DAPPUDRAFT_314784 [Daphnia pulex]|uniref:THAP-type domain-containing protein n=1 Tax=Daphnia pulex TaxID=6669 RepID=E9G7G4_DAPPU|nr:hypothetical protein DAPPUDRAFT_314784 [Daphnia pulex]|eukprot:EFX84458.1 hypothetical protein DAPPUDRAFT_314784 [Daphnia pulex]